MITIRAGTEVAGNPKTVSQRRVDQLRLRIDRPAWNRLPVSQFHPAPVPRCRLPMRGVVGTVTSGPPQRSLPVRKAPCRPMPHRGSLQHAALTGPSARISTAPPSTTDASSRSKRCNACSDRRIPASLVSQARSWRTFDLRFDDRRHLISIRRRRAERTDFRCDTVQSCAARTVHRFIRDPFNAAHAAVA